jgi:hypothetical protein
MLRSLLQEGDMGYEFEGGEHYKARVDAKTATPSPAINHPRKTMAFGVVTVWYQSLLRTANT